MYQQCIQLIKTVLVFSFMRWQENEGILNTNRSLIYYSTSLQSVDGKTKTFKKPTLPFKPSRLESDFFKKVTFWNLKSTGEAVVKRAGAEHLLCNYVVQKEFVNAPPHVALEGFLSLDEEQKGNLDSISDT